jgi:hypothetical protein
VNAAGPPPGPSLARPAFPWALLRAAALYAALTVLLTWPLARQLRVMDAGDSAFFAWTVGWAVHALFSDPAALPHGNFFHPLRYTLGMDEPVLGTTVLVLPLALFTGDAVLLHNVARLLTFFGAALSTWALARSLGLGEGPALAAGALFAYSPICTDQIAHLSTLGTQWLPLVLLFALRFFRTGAWRDALLAALFVALAGYACGYHVIIGAALLPIAFLPALWGRWRLLPRAAAAAGIAALLLWPLYWLHRKGLDQFAFARGEEEAIRYSAALETFLATSAWNRVWGEVTAPFRPGETNNLFPGLTVLVLAAAAVAPAVFRRERPTREVAVFALLAVAAVLFALGPEVRAFGRTLGPGPFALAREIPVFRMIRVTTRAGPFLALALAVLAAHALHRWRARPAVVAALAVAALAEGVIAPIPSPAWTHVVKSDEATPPVYAWLAAQPPGTVVAELPILEIRAVFERPAYHDSVYMVRSTTHWQPLVNGYAGLEPPDYVRMRGLCERFPDAACLEALAAQGARLVVLHRGGYGPVRWANRVEPGLRMATAEGARPRLREVARFDGDTVYALEP